MTDEGSKHERWSTISFYFYNRRVYVAENCSVSCYLPLHPPFFPVELATLYEISNFISSLKTLGYSLFEYSSVPNRPFFPLVLEFTK